MAYGDTASDSYPATSKWLHWLVALCVLTTAPVAIAMVQRGLGVTVSAALDIIEAAVAYRHC